MRLAVLLVLLLAVPAGASEPPAPTNEELARRVDALTREIEALQLGAVADTARLESRSGFGPAASRVYRTGQGVSIGGYGEVLFRRPDSKLENDQPSGLPPTLDVTRAIAYIGYKWTDGLLFNSEIEWEHGGIGDQAEVAVDTSSGAGDAELSGEVKLEFAYLDWMRGMSFGVRAGLLLLPVGLINELHEPTTYFGTTRPGLDHDVFPTTWSGVGVGLHGATGAGLEWRLYLTEGLDLSHASAEEPLRGGRQNGSQALATHAAMSGRLDWAFGGGQAGASFYTGNGWQHEQPAGASVSPVATLWDVHGRIERGGMVARGVFASGTLSEAGGLSDALGLAGAERLGERFGGWSLEAGIDVIPLIAPASRFALTPFLRYEEWDTQDSVPGGAEDPAFERRSFVAGLELRPHPNVVVKMDRQQLSTAADSGAGTWNAALGYVF